jgi:outer membrane protein OmpA-like peptidoglycan-associated protein
MKNAGLLALALVALAPLTASAQGTVTFGAGARGAASTSSPPTASAGSEERALAAAELPPGTPSAENADDKKWEERDRQLDEASTLTGGVGLMHTQHAEGGAPGQFSVAFTTEYFSAGFLCTNDFPCPDKSAPNDPTRRVRTDTNDHIGGHLTLSMQVLKWLEPYLSTSAYANSNDANRPSLLQVLGDSVLGAKAHGALDKRGIFNLGGAFELWLVNGTGSVGLDGAGTGAKFRALATADLRHTAKSTPLRFSINTTYVLDNTGEVVADTEKARGTSITRIERFGLGINRVDHFDIHLGAEVFAAREKVRPFLEYAISVPVNRQNYLCRPNNPSADNCLATDAIAPSSLTLGGRFFPWKRGFNLAVALDVGVTGVGEFIEEVRPTPPWMLYIGAGWGFDTVDRPPVYRERVVEKPVAAAPAGRKIRGWVHEEGKTDPVPNAIVTWANHPELTGLVTGSDGRFTTQDLPEGPYVFAIKADGYHEGQCQTTIVRPAAPPPPANAAARPGAPAAPPPPPVSGGDVQLDCPLQALPRVGTIVGKVKDLESGTGVASAFVKILDAQNKELTGTTDAMGNVRFQDVPPGSATVQTNVEGYLASTEKIDVKPRQDNVVEIALTKRPKKANVTIGKKELVIKQQIQFALDSAVILPESTGLLTEIADVLIQNPRIHQVEVQGHTDNTGTPEHNMTLSNDRASSVVAWLTSHGVAADRLTAKGYGQTKPLVPNVTARNRARNRRVQFIITDQEAAPKAAPKPKKKKK